MKHTTIRSTERRSTARSTAGALLLMLLTAVSFAADLTPVAIVTSARGDARMNSAQQPARVEALTEVRSGSVLTLDDGAHLVLAYSLQGHVFELSGPGRFRVERDAVRPVLIAGNKPGRIEQRQLALAFRELQVKPTAAVQATTVMRNGQQQAVVLLGPSGTQSAVDVRVLRWQALRADSNAWRYRVQLIDDDGMIVFHTETQQTEAVLPSSLQLQREKDYVWTLEAIDASGSRIQTAAQFTLVNERIDLALQEAQRAAQTDDAGKVLVELARRQYGLATSATTAAATSAQ